MYNEKFEIFWVDISKDHLFLVNELLLESEVQVEIKYFSSYDRVIENLKIKAPRLIVSNYCLQKGSELLLKRPEEMDHRNVYWLYDEVKKLYSEQDFIYYSTMIDSHTKLDTVKKCLAEIPLISKHEPSLMAEAIKKLVIKTI